MKRLGAILIVLVLAISAAAASVDISLAVGGRATYGQLDWDTTTENGARIEMNSEGCTSMLPGFIAGSTIYTIGAQPFFPIVLTK